ncbi:MAG: hypothetical protein N2749_03145 [Clostridia bacterium]|nr:hypothetical protein [Clostridia bacterium]
MKKIMLFICIILLIAILIFFIFSKTNSYQKSIYNDAEKISVIGDSYSFNTRNGNFINDKFSISFKGFSGKQTLWKLAAKEDSMIDISYNVEIKSGKFKICLIDENEGVESIVVGSKVEDAMIDVRKGDNYITIVGNGASGKIDLSIIGNDKVSLKQVNN